jgi:hypothetical protein
MTIATAKRRKEMREKNSPQKTKKKRKEKKRKAKRAVNSTGNYRCSSRQPAGYLFPFPFAFDSSMQIYLLHFCSKTITLLIYYHCFIRKRKKEKKTSFLSAIFLSASCSLNACDLLCRSLKKGIYTCTAPSPVLASWGLRNSPVNLIGVFGGLHT